MSFERAPQQRRLWRVAGTAGVWEARAVVRLEHERAVRHFLLHPVPSGVRQQLLVLVDHLPVQHGPHHRRVAGLGGVAHRQRSVDADAPISTASDDIGTGPASDVEHTTRLLQQLQHAQLVGLDLRPPIDTLLPGDRLVRIVRAVDVRVGRAHRMMLTG